MGWLQEQGGKISSGFKDPLQEVRRMTGQGEFRIDNMAKEGIGDFGNRMNKMVAGVSEQYGPGSDKWNEDYPVFRDVLGPDGTLLPQYQVNAGQAQTDLSSILAPGQAGQAMIDRATATGPSAWLGLQEQAIDRRQQDQLNMMEQQAAGASAQARSNLAMRGGLGGGAAERLARGSMLDQMLGSQDIRRGAGTDKLSAAIADEEMKAELLGSASNLESGLARTRAGLQTGIDQFNVNKDMAAQDSNINRALGRIGTEEQRDYDKWKFGKEIESTGRLSKAMGQQPQQGGGLEKFLNPSNWFKMR